MDGIDCSETLAKSSSSSSGIGLNLASWSTSSSSSFEDAGLACRLVSASLPPCGTEYFEDGGSGYTQSRVPLRHPVTNVSIPEGGWVAEGNVTYVHKRGASRRTGKKLGIGVWGGKLEAVAHLDPSTTAGKTAAASSSVFDVIRTGGRLSSVSLGSRCLEQARLWKPRVICHVLEFVRFHIASSAKSSRRCSGSILRVQARVGPQS